MQSLVGSLVGAGLILAIALLYKAVRKVDGMGGGDVKLMAMIGAFLGWKMIFPVLFIVAALFGSIYGVWLMRSDGHGKTAVAFGSFLAPAACLMMFAGETIARPLPRRWPPLIPSSGSTAPQSRGLLREMQIAKRVRAGATDGADSAGHACS